MGEGIGPVTTGTNRGGSSRTVLLLVLALVAGMILGALGVAGYSALGDDEETSETVTLRSFEDRGDDPFTDSAAATETASLSDFAESGAADGPGLAEVTTAGLADRGRYPAAPGAAPGLFGGAENQPTCDTAQLASQLAAEEAKASAWASVLAIDPGEIETYVDGLTAVHLGFDTRVGDNGFADGSVVKRQAVLQRGTAVLVDSRGVPRVNCSSGNPLLDPELADDESYRGDRWDSFEQNLVVVVVAAPTDVSELVLADITSGERFSRPVGTTGEADAKPGATTTEVTTAGAIALDTLVAGSITADDTDVRYEIDAPAGTLLTLSVANRADSIARVAVAMTAAGEQFTFFRVPPNGADEFTLLLDDDGGGPFEIVFTEGPAEFEFSVATEAQADGGQAGDAGDEFATGFEISNGQAVDGRLGDLDVGDRYLLAVEGAPALVLTIDVPRESPARAAFAVELAGDQLEFVRVEPGGTATFELLFGPDDVGELEIAVTEGPALYGFTAELVPQDDGGLGGDATGELADAATLDDLTAISGEVGRRDDADLFLFDATAEEHTIEVSVDATSEARIAVSVIGPDGGSLTFFRVEPGVTVTETFTAVPGEGHRLQVTEGRGSYTISIS